MGNHPAFILVLLAAFVASALAKKAVPTTNTSYILVTSDALVPGSELVIDLHLLDLISNEATEKDKGDCVLDLSVSSEGHFWHRTEWEIEVEGTPKSFHNSLRILVSSDESRLGETTELKVESKSCFLFSRSFQLNITKKELLVSLRTDKLKYQPGEYVLVESLVLSHELRPHLKPVNLSIHNSRGDVLVRWINVTAGEGLIREKYYVPLLAHEGELTVTLESHEQQVNHTVHVEHPKSPYDEEMFEVDVRSPRYLAVHTSDESKSANLEVSIVASHHSGVPVLGGVELTLSLVNGSKTKSMTPSELEAGHKLISLKLEEVRNLLGLPKEESLVGHTVQLEVKVEEKPLLDNRERNESRPEERKEEREDEKKEERKEERMDEKSTVWVTRVLNVTFVDQSHVLFFSEMTPLFFNPGLTYVGQVLLKPVEELLPKSPEEKEVTVKVKHYTSGSETPKEEELKLKLRPNSIGEFSVKVPKENIKMELEAVYDDKESGKVVKAHLEEVLPFGSKDGHYLQVLLKEKPPKVLVGETLEVKIETTFPTTEFLYKVFCQSLLVLSGTVTLPSPTNTHELSLIIPHNVSHLLSSPRLVVLALTPSEELASDSLRFVVEQREEKPLELELKSEVTELGGAVELLVRAEPFTIVFLLSTSDQLVYETKEQELRKHVAHEKMSRYLRYLNSSHFTQIVEELCESCSTLPSLAPDSERVFNESLGLLLTDGLLYSDPSKPWPPPSRTNGTLDNLEPLKIESHVEFETRLWPLNVTVGLSGEEKLEFVVPEGGRLYTLAAFGLRPGKGLVVSKEPLQLMATSKVLATLRHPESAVRGEEIVVEVHLFNNQDKDAQVEVSLKSSPTHELPCAREEPKEKPITLTLNAKETKAVPLHLMAPSTSQEPLEVQVEISSEGVHLNLSTEVKLRYQGYEVEHPESVVLDNFDGTQVLRLDLTKNITNPIENSERGHVKIYGHPLGSAIEHVCRELNESSVLEERTKMWFVLAVNILEHISNNSLFENSVHVEYGDVQLPFNASLGVPTEKNDCIKSVREALEYLLHKKNPDGSVSFYSTSPGYTWLTTLMLDANLHLQNVRHVDEEEVIEMVEWLVGQQKDDGYYVESNKSVSLRIHIEETLHVPLTSKVVITLLEANEKLELPEKTSELIKSSTKKAVDYVIKTVSSGQLDKDYYSLSLAACSLALDKNENIVEVLVKRDASIIHEGLKSFWEDDLELTEERSLSVEATSYAVLTSLVMNDLDGATPFVNFLTSKMQPGGEFVTAEDTYVALRALSQYYRLLDIYHQHEQVNIDVNVTVSGKETVSLKVLDPLFVGELYFDHSNLSLSVGVKVESSGEGLLLVQTDPKYNEAVPTPRATAIDLKVEVNMKDPEHLELKVCAKYLGKETSRFVIGEVPLLSGYELNVEKVESRPNLQVLKQDDVVYLFYNQLSTSTPDCVELHLEKIFPVGHLEQRTIRLYPVNDPDMTSYKLYPGEKADSMLESICPR